jgi:enolase-phosphatase E1
MSSDAARVVLLDVEGTVAPISYVYETMFPYARKHVGRFVREHSSDPAVVKACEQIFAEASASEPRTLSSEAGLENLERSVGKLMDADAKSTGLKELQGLIWAEGYRSGELRSKVFADVAPAFRRWRDAGKTLAIYSSGSVGAQKVFFAHTEAGDLTPMLSAHFDTTSGPKRLASSYTTIAQQLGFKPAEILFLSDVLEELTAAREAGMLTALVVRPGNKPVPDDAPQPRIQSFDELK